MYAISSEIYDHITSLLVDAIGDKVFFSGSVSTYCGEVYMRLTGTLFVYRNASAEGRRGGIDDIVPVWWEFHTLCGGEEVLNDFSFAELREHIA